MKLRSREDFKKEIKSLQKSSKESIKYKNLFEQEQKRNSNLNKSLKGLVLRNNELQYRLTYEERVSNLLKKRMNSVLFKQLEWMKDN